MCSRWAIDDRKTSRRRALCVSEERSNLAVESAQLALWIGTWRNDKLWMTDDGRKFFGFEAGRTD
jgi:hypothetical protein